MQSAVLCASFKQPTRPVAAGHAASAVLNSARSAAVCCRRPMHVCCRLGAWRAPCRTLPISSPTDSTSRFLSRPLKSEVWTPARGGLVSCRCSSLLVPDPVCHGRMASHIIVLFARRLGGRQACKASQIISNASAFSPIGPSAPSRPVVEMIDRTSTTDQSAMLACNSCRPGWRHSSCPTCGAR